MKIEHIVERLDRYIERNILPTMNNGQKIAIRTFVGAVKANPHAFKKRLLGDSFLGWFVCEDENGEIDVDGLLEGLKDAVSKEGHLILDTKMFGRMTFHPPDVENLVRCMRE